MSARCHGAIWRGLCQRPRRWSSALRRRGNLLGAHHRHPFRRPPGGLRAQRGCRTRGLGARPGRKRGRREIVANRNRAVLEACGHFSETAGHGRAVPEMQRRVAGVVLGQQRHSLSGGRGVSTWPSAPRTARSFYPLTKVAPGPRRSETYLRSDVRPSSSVIALLAGSASSSTTGGRTMTRWAVVRLPKGSRTESCLRQN